MVIFVSHCFSGQFRLQDDDSGANADISKREKQRLKEMQKLKKQKIQELLDKQNAAIDADMVCPFALFVNGHITSAC